MNTNLKGKQFNYDQVRGLFLATLQTSGTLIQTGPNVWRVQFDKPVQGLDLKEIGEREFSTVDEVIDAILPHFMDNYKNIGMVA